MRSMRWILFVSFLVVTLVAVGVVAGFTLRSAATEIAEYDDLADELEMGILTRLVDDLHELNLTGAASG